MRSWKTLKDYVIVIFVAAIFAFCARLFIVEGFRIPTDFMAPGLRAGDHIFVSKVAYGLRYPSSGFATTKLKMPNRGDVVVFALNSDSNREYIKRVVAVAGDHIKIENSILILNGNRISRLISERDSVREYEETLDGRTYTVQWKSAGEMAEVVVPQDQYFVLGDSRSEGIDSRNWGFLPIASLVGRASLVWLSIATEDKGLGIRWSRFLRKVY